MNLIRKGWIECQRTENGQAYRLTDLGLQANNAPLQIDGARSARGQSGAWLR